MPQIKFLRLLTLLVSAALLLVPLTAQAHVAVDSGSYHFEIGWLNEPVLIGERNALDLFVAAKAKPDEGLAGVESALKFTVEYGGVSQSYDLAPVENEPGHYNAVFVPTRLGQYTFHLTGAINGETVDVKVEPEEVVAAGKLAFPAAQPALTDLQTQLAAVQAQVRSAQTLALVGLSLGIIGTGVGIYALMKKK